MLPQTGGSRRAMRGAARLVDVGDGEERLATELSVVVHSPAVTEP